MLLCAAAAFGQSAEERPGGGPTPGAGKIIVHSKFGGQIYGFDIDQRGTEATYTREIGPVQRQRSGGYRDIQPEHRTDLKVVSETDNQDNFVTYGVVGTSVGLIEQEIVTGIYVTSRVYPTMNPLS